MEILNLLALLKPALAHIAYAVSNSAQSSLLFKYLKQDFAEHGSDHSSHLNQNSVLTLGFAGHLNHQPPTTNYSQRYGGRQVRRHHYQQLSSNLKLSNLKPSNFNQSHFKQQVLARFLIRFLSKFFNQNYFSN